MSKFPHSLLSFCSSSVLILCFGNIEILILGFSILGNYSQRKTISAYTLNQKMKIRNQVFQIMWWARKRRIVILEILSTHEFGDLMNNIYWKIKHLVMIFQYSNFSLLRQMCQFCRNTYENVWQQRSKFLIFPYALF